MAVYAGFTSSPVARILQSMWSELSKSQHEILGELDVLFGREHSCQFYRQQYNLAALPCIPYLGLHLRDITFLEENIPDKLGEMINFSKRRQISLHIVDVLKSQSVPYNYQYVHQIAVLLKDFKLLDTKEMYEKTLIYELYNLQKSA